MSIDQITADGGRTALTARTPAAIPRRPALDRIPLSFAQQRLWFLDQLEPGNTAYTIPVLLRITGAIDARLLARSVEEIIRRHESLRTIIRTEGGQPFQEILPPYTVQLEPTDLTAQPNASKLAEGMGRARVEVRKPFDLSRGPLFRANLWRLGDEDHLLLLTIHHIIADGWSVGLILRELQALYDAYRAGRPSPSREPEIQYADYAVWQREWLRGPVIEGQLAYWKKHLAVVPRVLELPTDRPRPSVQSMRGREVPVALSQGLSEELHRLSRREHVTLFMTLTAALQTLLARYSGQTDFLLGIPIAGRVRVETEHVVGLFVNTLALRADLSEDPTFSELLKRVLDDALGAYAHQDLPFDRLVEELRPERSPAYSPLVQVMFAFENVPLFQGNEKTLQCEPLRVESETSKFDLSLTLYEENGLRGFFEYATDLFDPPTIQRMSGHFQTLLRAICEHPDTPLSRLPILTDEERSALLSSAIRPRFARTPQPIHELFDAQVSRLPRAVAIEQGKRSVSYAELQRWSRRIAARLRAEGVHPEMTVGVCMNRSPEMVAVLLGILRAGGAYVPVDPDVPQERIRFVLEDAHARLVLTQARYAPVLSGLHAVTLIVQPEAEGLADPPAEFQDPSIGAETLAYVMYTSGSTGVPKGVEVTHGALASHCVECRDFYGLHNNDRVLQFASLSADVSLEQILPPLVSGAAVVLREQELLAPEELRRYILNAGLTVVNLPTSYWHQVAEEWANAATPVRFPRLRLVIVGGEAMLPQALMMWHRTTLSNVRLLNAYGPTETTITAATFEIPARTQGAGEGVLQVRIPIGKARGERTLLVLDGNLQPVPVGITGELFIGGPCLARGYLGRPEQTSEMFIADPFAPGEGRRLYRTGDLARLLPGGDIEFIGRRDSQVKIRGFRVELGEVEAVLAQCAGVRECAVAALNDVSEGNRLVAYVVPSPQGSATASSVREYLMGRVPSYMVPSSVVLLDGLPLTPNGKVDRRSLPVPAPAGGSGERTIKAPRDILEKQLANIWERLFNTRPIGVRDNFFELGGHSLLAVRLFSEVEKLTGQNLPLVTLFQAPTIEALAGVLRNKGWQAHWSSLVPIRAGGSKPPFYCVHGVGGNILEFEHFSRYFDPDRPLYGLQAQGLDGKRPRHTSVEEMAAHYVREIREFQPTGPYYLGGSSFGGMVAFEMARRLTADGQRVGLLALFDTNAPGYPRYLPAITAFRKRLDHLRFRVELHWSNIRVAEPAIRREYLRAKTERFIRQYRAKGRRKLLTMVRRVQEIFLPRAIRHVKQGGHQANRMYEPKPYAGKITLFRATEQPYGIILDRTNGWAPFAAGGIDVHDIPGHHGAIMREPRAKILVQTLMTCLEPSGADAVTLGKENERGQ
ncbi:MAG: amino acid adenylation domain-containing protein [Bacteroidota bacterium]